MSDEDEGLIDNGDLEVDDHVKLTIVVVDCLAGWGLQRHAELVLEERCLDNDDDENDPKITEIN